MAAESVQIDGPGAGHAEECEMILRSVPEWFGIESALMQYVKDAAEMPTFTARPLDGGAEAIGFLTVNRHFDEAAEIHCMAVRRSERNRGVGKALLAATENWLRGEGTRFLQVKTLSPSHPSPEYAETRDFYRRAGFVPLEEMPTLWSEANPCLIMVKRL